MPHIILCGNITYVGVFYFFKELYHRTRDSRQLRVVFLSRKEPSLELKSLLESPYYSERVRYLVGSALVRSGLSCLVDQTRLTSVMVFDRMTQI